METTQIRATKQLTNRLKDIIVVRGKKESMATLIDNLLDEESKKYLLTQDGYAKVGDKLQLANNDRELTDELVEIVLILEDDVLLNNKTTINRNGRIGYFSKIIN